MRTIAILILAAFLTGCALNSNLSVTAFCTRSTSGGGPVETDGGADVAVPVKLK